MPTIRQLWTLDGRFSDPKHGVTFRYPSVWSSGGTFTRWSPALGTDNNAAVIHAFGFYTGGFPRASGAGPYAHTTLGGAALVYTALMAADAASCEVVAAELADDGVPRYSSWGGRRFTVRTVSEGALSHWIDGTLYSAYANATCYLFEISIDGTIEETWEDVPAEEQAGDDAGGIFLRSPTRAQNRTIDRGLRRIMHSVRIEPVQQK